MTGQDDASSIRVDKWLWYARAFKSRTQAAAFVSGGKVRVNRQKITKPGTAIHIGDVLTFVRGRDVRVYRVLALGTRRGPAVEAQLLYENIVEDEPRKKEDQAC